MAAHPVAHPIDKTKSYFSLTSVLVLFSSLVSPTSQDSYTYTSSASGTFLNCVRLSHYGTYGDILLLSVDYQGSKEGIDM